MNELTITIPWTPPRALSPNASRKQHWSVKSKAQAQAKKDAKYATKDALAGRPAPLPSEGPIPYRVIVGWEKGRNSQQDDDNVIASMKWTRDTVCSVLDIDDKRLRLTGVEQVRDLDGIGWTKIILQSVAKA